MHSDRRARQTTESASQRLFVGIEANTPAFHDGALQALCNARHYLPARALREVAPANRHMTLAFLGEVAQSAFSGLFARLEQVRFQRFSLEFTGLSLFPRPGAPRMLVMEAVASPEVTELRQQILACCKASGLWVDRKPFRPHVTLARLRRPHVPARPDWPGLIQLAVPALPVERFCVYASERDASGVVYRIVASFPASG